MLTVTINKNGLCRSNRVQSGFLENYSETRVLPRWLCSHVDYKALKMDDGMESDFWESSEEANVV